MKKIFSVFILAAAIMTTVSAAENEPKQPKRANVWYEFTQDVDDDPMNPNNYTNRGATNPTGCSAGNQLCSVNLPDSGEHPSQADLDAIQGQIETGQQTDEVTFKN